eukprot:5941333-Alexandrium_andersonii.AAC.1
MPRRSRGARTGCVENWGSARLACGASSDPLNSYWRLRISPEKCQARSQWSYIWQVRAVVCDDDYVAK